MPELPDECPQRRPGDPGCDVRGKSTRARITGPCITLVIARCLTHKSCFTLYPPGYGPYQRRSVLEQSLEGQAVIREKAEIEAMAGGQQDLADFQDTLFQAALNAERGMAWDREDLGPTPPDGWWSTQGRHVDLATRILGIAPGTGDRLREAIAETLKVDHQLLLDQGKAEQTGYVSRGKAVCTVLRALKRQADCATRLLHCGYLIGKWPRPCVWDPKRKYLKKQPFRVAGTAAPT